MCENSKINLKIILQSEDKLEGFGVGWGIALHRIGNPVLTFIADIIWEYCRDGEQLVPTIIENGIFIIFS